MVQHETLQPSPDRHQLPSLSFQNTTRLIQDALAVLRFRREMKEERALKMSIDFVSRDEAIYGERPELLRLAEGVNFTFLHYFPPPVLELLLKADEARSQASRTNTLEQIGY